MNCITKSILLEKIHSIESKEKKRKLILFELGIDAEDVINYLHAIDITLSHSSRALSELSDGAEIFHNINMLREDLEIALENCFES